MRLGGAAWIKTGNNVLKDTADCGRFHVVAGLRLMNGRRSPASWFFHCDVELNPDLGGSDVSSLTLWTRGRPSVLI